MHLFKKRTIPPALSLSGLSVLATVALFSCLTPPVEPPPGTLLSTGTIQGKYEPSLGSMVIAVDVIAVPGVKWVGYDVYMTNDLSIQTLDSNYFINTSVQNLQPGRQYLNVNPGANIGERLVAISLLYLRDGNDTSRAKLSNAAFIPVTKRANLGCKKENRATRGVISLCLDTALVRRVDPAVRFSNPYVRYAVLDVADMALSPEARSEKKFGSSQPSLAELSMGGSSIVDGNKWQVDTLPFRLDQLNPIPNSLPEINVLVEYAILNYENLDNWDIVRETVTIPFDNSPPNIGFTPDVEGKELTITLPGTGNGSRKIFSQFFTKDKISFSVPPNAPGVKDKYRIRLLYPYQGMPEYSSAANLNFPFLFEGTNLKIDPAFQNQLQPGGWIAMQWKEFDKINSGGELDLRKYVEEFNALSPESRKWELKDTAGSAVKSGTIQFNYDQFDTYLKDGIIRKIDPGFPPRKPIYEESKIAKGGFNFVDSAQNGQELQLDFFKMPSHWSIEKRVRSFVMEFEFTGLDFDGRDIRRVYSLNKADLALLVGAPRYNFITLDNPSDVTIKGARHLEGFMASERPVSKNFLYFSFQSKAGYTAKNLLSFAYYAWIPPTVGSNENRINTDEKYLQPIIKAVQANNYYASDTLSMRVLQELGNNRSILINEVKDIKLTGTYQPNVESATFNVTVDTKEWQDGTYIFWFATSDIDFVSGPLIDGFPGPALEFGMSFNPKKKTISVDDYRKATNPRIFKYKRP